VLRAIFDGDESANGADASDSLAAGEDGKIALVAVLTLFLFLVLATLVVNLGTALHQKIHVQNSADAVAVAAALQDARTLNTITAANHLTGELLALVVIHEAIGCRYENRDQDGPQDTTSLDNQMMAEWVTHEMRKIPAQRPDGKLTSFDDVQGKKVYAVYALLDSHKDLKQSVLTVYRIRNLGLLCLALQDVPYVGPVFLAIGRLLYDGGGILEQYMHQVEWRILRGLEDAARTTIGARKAIYDITPKLRRFSDRVLQNQRNKLTQTAKGVGDQNGVKAAIYPEELGFRLVEEEGRVDFDVASVKQQPGSTMPSDPDFAHAQIVRATYPWVNYHRQFLFPLGRLLIFSQFSKHYREWTTKITLTRCAEYYLQSSTHLYVFRGSQPRRKGRESWTRSTAEAEKMFTLMGFAHRPPPERSVASFFPAGNPDGTLAYAQAIVYNANEQRPDATPARFQPWVGWDTLNWSSPVRDSNALEWPSFSASRGFPKVFLNWQVKLVPVTRLAEARDQLAAPFSAAVQKVDTNLPMVHAH
jgi:hypothetical protein